MQSPFWKKFREALVVNPDITTGSWVRNTLKGKKVTNLLLIGISFLEITNKFRNPEPGSRPETYSLPPTKGVYNSVIQDIVKRMTNLLDMIANDPAQNAYFQRDFR